MVAAILQSTIGPQSRLPMLGDWGDPNGVRYNQYTPRSSDFMPGHFRAFRRVTGQAAWTEVVRQTQRGVSRTLLCLLVMTRNFWDPTTIDTPREVPSTY